MRRSTFLAAVLAALAATTFSASAQTTSILNDVIKRGEIRVATIAGNPPYSSLSPSGEPVGYDIDIANLIGAALKVKVKFLIVDVPGRIVALQTGRADITVANFTNTVERSTPLHSPIRTSSSARITWSSPIPSSRRWRSSTRPRER